MNFLRAVLLLSGGFPTGGFAAQASSMPIATICPSDVSSCTSSFKVDLDGDGKEDQAELHYDKDLKFYFVVLKSGAGLTYWPFSGGFDPAKDRVTLTYRQGGGDIRCRKWVRGKQCGYPVSDVFRGTVLFLSHSRQGDFVLYLSAPHLKPNVKPSDYSFHILPALEGEPTDPL